ncbi:hypothetical protein BCV70DRAFT_200459 [Testicularia cyperi]|uniref:SnoaL-like domain-containing protein n=1 Tax=Testicularia cyperi TaxID=1882483 RepID=A0A317XSM0_9BASI|nr:hypothetical protein BCV70DRAFT_200459 [Testicularia cyperi]
MRISARLSLSLPLVALVLSQSATPAVSASALRAGSTATTATTARTAAAAFFALAGVSASSNTNVDSNAQGGGKPVAQRAFRLGRAAAGLNTQPPPGSLPHKAQYSTSTMSSSTTSQSPSLPAQDQSFPGFESTPLIEPDSSTAQLIQDAQDLFGAKPTPQIFTRSWSPHATFADPICHANGAKQYLPQWYGMPAAFAQSTTLAWKLIRQDPDRVEYVQKQHYKVKGLGTEKTMVSTVYMERDPQTNKITRFEDRWNHKPLGGAFSWPFRRLNAVTMPFLVGVPQDTKEMIDRSDL